MKQIVYLNISSSFLFHHLSAISFSSSFPSFSSLFSSRSYFILFRFSLPLSSPFSTYCSFSPFLYVPLDFFFFFLSIFCASSFVSSLPLSHFLLLLLLSLLFLFLLILFPPFIFLLVLIIHLLLFHSLFVFLLLSLPPSSSLSFDVSSFCLILFELFLLFFL